MRQSLVITRIATALIVTTILTGASFAGDSPEAADLAAELRATNKCQVRSSAVMAR